METAADEVEWIRLVMNSGFDEFKALSFLPLLGFVGGRSDDV